MIKLINIPEGFRWPPYADYLRVYHVSTARFLTSERATLEWENVLRMSLHSELSFSYWIMYTQLNVSNVEQVMYEKIWPLVWFLDRFSCFFKIRQCKGSEFAYSYRPHVTAMCKLSSQDLPKTRLFFVDTLNITVLRITLQQLHQKGCIRA
jgi:hypothetical protein